MKPYYEDDRVQLWHGDCLEIDAWLTADALVTDPPFGIQYKSGAQRQTLPDSIIGDDSTVARDLALTLWEESGFWDRLGDRAALVFGTWRIPRPAGARALLVWDTKGALGMGDLSIPWKPSHQEIYVLGSGFHGRRDSDVICCAPVQSMAKNGRVHPHEKPVHLLERLIEKCPAGVVADPFSGAGSTLIAARNLGRKAIGVEIEERYCEIIARRLDQMALDFEAGA